MTGDSIDRLHSTASQIHACLDADDWAGAAELLRTLDTAVRTVDFEATANLSALGRAAGVRDRLAESATRCQEERERIAAKSLAIRSGRKATTAYQLLH